MILLRQWLLFVFAMAFFNASVFGAHLHLCLDGQSPPSTSHLFDLTELEHAPGLSETHDDIDVRISHQARAGKIFKYSPAWIAIAAPSWSTPAVSFDKSWCGPDLQSPHLLQSPREFLPPQRGPPV